MDSHEKLDSVDRPVVSIDRSIDVITQQFVFFSLLYIVGKLVINDVGIGLGNPCLMMPGN